MCWGKGGASRVKVCLGLVIFSIIEGELAKSKERGDGTQLDSQ